MLKSTRNYSRLGCNFRCNQTFDLVYFERKCLRVNKKKMCARVSALVYFTAFICRKDPGSVLKRDFLLVQKPTRALGARQLEQTSALKPFRRCK